MLQGHSCRWIEKLLGVSSGYLYLKPLHRCRTALKKTLVPVGSALELRARRADSTLTLAVVMRAGPQPGRWQLGGSRTSGAHVFINIFSMVFIRYKQFDNHGTLLDSLSSRSPGLQFRQAPPNK
ncbi:Hypothetical_protein [Hexamita inflata]|uniref:Hypothetical_protein n=1 Tax=Hexamita inflata TaxID=28002 RepID=A0AA86QZ32_9EUKA|nr:Hypothetical protein HINF_LOCUS50827 [Hexamita inflata]